MYIGPSAGMQAVAKPVPVRRFRTHLLHSFLLGMRSIAAYIEE
ncbi:hypothetical protein HMPREF3038_00374 [Akkermansia sp. KLE1797]|nr:hypothetical protein HMPREF3038_00374 [Akkermansia sp. KLE1797]